MSSSSSSSRHRPPPSHHPNEPLSYPSYPPSPPLLTSSISPPPSFSSPPSTLPSPLTSFLCGLSDSLRFLDVVVFFYTSQSIRRLTLQTFLLNGIIFVGSIAIVNYVIRPMIITLLGLAIVIDGDEGHSSSSQMTSVMGGQWDLYSFMFPSSATSSLASASSSLPPSPSPSPSDSFFSSFSSFVNVLYDVFWFYPLWGISFLLSAIWYSEIAQAAFILQSHRIVGGKNKKNKGVATGILSTLSNNNNDISSSSPPSLPPSPPFSFTKWISLMSEEIYRVLLVTTFLIQTSLVSLLPFIGPPLSLLHVSLMYSLYSFEYKWTFLKWSLEERMEYLERRAAYFCGFGFLSALSSFVLPKFVGGGIFAFTFPIFIILATVAEPIPNQNHHISSPLSSSPSSYPYPYPPSSFPSPPSSSSLPYRLPIFRVSIYINNFLLSLMQKIFRSKSRQKQREKMGR